MKNRKNLSGLTVGRLYIAGYAGDGRWLCNCACGASCVVRTTNLTSMKTKSCGCLVRERAFTLNRRRKPVAICACGDHAFTSLTQGFSTIVSPGDIHFLEKESWCAALNGKRGFRVVNGRRKKLHRVILGLSDRTHIVDHINGNRFDNRRDNLRVCVSAQNSHNQSPHKDKTHSRYKGVTRDKRAVSKPWIARIMANGILRNLGSFETAEQAAAAYDAAALEMHGDFARTNSSMGLLPIQNPGSD